MGNLLQAFARQSSERLRERVDRGDFNLQPKFSSAPNRHLGSNPRQLSTSKRDYERTKASFQFLDITVS